MVSLEEMEDSDKRSFTCTWDKNSDCINCEIKGNLDCKWKKALLIRFYKGALPALLFGGIGFVLVALFVSFIPLLIYIGFWIFFFGFFEIRVLCSHCPYYAKPGFVLHCLANHGTIKLWRYHPEPMNFFEKSSFLAGALFFVLFPVLGEIYGIYALLVHLNPNIIQLIALISLANLSFFSGIYFFYFLLKNTCPKCVNFSCPLNKVPKHLVDSYLQKNLIMKKAWEGSGYRLD